MAWLQPRLVVAFDAGSVAGVAVSGGLRRPRADAWVRVPLPSGALRPSLAEPNVIDPGGVAASVRDLAQRLGKGSHRAVLVLPEGAARTALLEPTAGVDLREFARFRMTQSLPYPPAEALVDTLAVGRGRHLGGAVRRSVVEGYEAAAEAAGIRAERVDLAPLVAVAVLKRLTDARDGGVALLLGDTALSFAGFSRGRLAAFRTRLREAGPEEAEWLRDELQRTAALVGEEPSGRVVVVGAGALAVTEALRALGCAAEQGHLGKPRGEDPAETAELSWLAAALA